MYSRRLIGNMSVRALAWLALAVAAQVGLAGAPHRDEYAVVLRDAPLQRTMDRAIDLIRAPAAWNLLGGESAAGAGIKIGVIDTGIEQSHAAFQDDSLAVPDGFPKGSAAELAYTNHKVIVARSYVA